MRSLVKGLLMAAGLAFAATSAIAQVVLPGAGGTPPPTPQTGAPTAGGLITKITPQQVAQLITSAVSGVTISPQINQNQDGSYNVSFPVWGNQVFSAVTVENCEKDGSGCYALEFFANFGKQSTIDQNWVNAWNNNFFAVRVVPLPDGEIVFEADLMVLSGVTPQYVTAFAGFFKQVVDNAATYKPPPPAATPPN